MEGRKINRRGEEREREAMALTSFLPSSTPTTTHHRHHSRHHHHSKHQNNINTKKIPKPSPPPHSSSSSSWEQLKSLLSCRSTAAATTSQVHDPASAAGKLRAAAACGSSICALRDVVHGNTRVVHRSDTDLSSDNNSSTSRSLHHETAPLASRSSAAARSARHSYQPTLISGCGGGGSSSSYSSKAAGMPLRKLSSCYECHAVSVEPGSRRNLRSRSSMCACLQCGEVFSKPESLEMHEAVRHAVSELGPEDSGRNIVEIIFKSSWQKKDRPIVQIERILKVHNTSRTVARFEDYRNAVKSRHLHQLLPHPSAAGVRVRSLGHLPQKKDPRCAADGNELLRFHSTTLSCPLGADGSAGLCSAANDTAADAGACGVCTVIRRGFARPANQLPYGVRTTASSGRAHDCRDGGGGGGEMRAMLVCRVIAGRVRRQGAESPAVAGEEEGYDSLAAGEGGGAYGNIEELFVANPRAILPCFVVIYRALD